MKILDSEIENFLTISQAKVVMADRGLVLVQGDNQADTSTVSNGAGKSSFAEAQFWCFFGETSRGVSGDDVINWVAKKGTRVANRVEDDGLIYTISRHRKHKVGKNSLRVTMLDKDGDTHDLTKGTDKLTQQVVNDILGASRDVFVAAVLAGQGQMPDLPGMTDKNLKVIVEEAAGTTVLERGHKVALAQLGEAKEAMVKTQITVTAATDRLAQFMVFRDRAAQDMDEWENARKLEIAQRTDQVKAIVEEVRVARTELGKTDRAAIQAQLDAEEAKLAGLAGEVIEERRLVDDVSRASSYEAATRHAVETLTQRAQKQRKDHDALDHQVGCPCSSCDKPYTAADIAPAKVKAADFLRTLVGELRDAKSTNASAVAALTDARTALAAHRTSMTDASATTALSGQLRASLAAYDRELARIQTRAAEARAENDRIKALQTRPNPHEASHKRGMSSVTDGQQALKDAEAALVETQTEVEIAKEVVEVFAPSGARAEMLDEVTPYLNAQTAKYLGTLSDGNIRATWSTLSRDAKGNLKEKFAIDVTHDQGGEKFAAISGGEQRKVRVAAALALQDLVASRATKPIELFIGDEIDDALDPAGVERLTGILQEKARERGTVFIISHSDLKDWVPQVMKVTKTARGQSTIEEVFA